MPEAHVTGSASLNTTEQLWTGKSKLNMLSAAPEDTLHTRLCVDLKSTLSLSQMRDEAQHSRAAQAQAETPQPVLRHAAASTTTRQQTVHSSTAPALRCLCCCCRCMHQNPVPPTTSVPCTGFRHFPKTQYPAPAETQAGTEPLAHTHSQLAPQNIPRTPVHKERNQG
jgi:hypothetical protein